MQGIQKDIKPIFVIKIYQMAKKNTGKVTAQLSPENYIRTRSRTLPIFECWINSNWQESKMASIVIVRQHTNSNLTYCYYLVDLMCLGVKYSQFEFNETTVHYQSRMDEFRQDVDLIPVEYALAHNIIYAGIEYAEEYEFKPFKDFTNITQYFLEEDNESIELIEIECGDENGQPCYIYNGLLEDKTELRRITAQLERIAGSGNYTLISEKDLEEDFEEDDDDPYEYFDDDDEFDDEEDYDEIKGEYVDYEEVGNDLEEDFTESYSDEPDPEK